MSYYHIIKILLKLIEDVAINYNFRSDKIKNYVFFSLK